MRKFLTLLAATALLLGLGAMPSQADWGPADGHKMHFPQLPDENGYDVKATFPLVLADDFRCSESGWIKDIHFWGSWLHGVPGQILSFTLSIHADIPADPPGIPYSMPGALLWERDIAQFIAQPIPGGAIEDWYDPQTGEVIFNDHTEYWQYNIFLDSLDWFKQVEGTIYWLNVTAHVMDPTATQWGWKTSLNHFNDDAVWTEAGSGVWNELTEPNIATPVTDLFWGGLDMAGQLLPGSGGVNAFGAGWYYYPEENWWNIWFYDHPFRTDRFKNVVLEIDVFKADPGLPSFVEIAVNYSTAWWSTTGNPEPAPRVPPLPGCIEDSAIGRVTLLLGPDLQGHYILPWEFPEYNPEWVSIDIRGTNFIIPEGMGRITHACLPKGEPVSLDLAFVINGGPATIGWDCYDNPPPGKTGGGPEAEPNDACQIANPAQCEYAYCGVISPLVVQDQDWWRVDLPNMTDICYCVHARVFGNDTPGQYAAGGGLDPDLTVYRADCSTVLFYNNDHMGTFPDAVGRDAQYDCSDQGNCYPGGTTLYLRVSGDPALTAGPYLLVVNCIQCECPQPPRDTVKCEPQGGLNPTHPGTYWYDVTPTQFGRCDFHVEVFDSVLTHYSNFVDPPTWTHALHKAGGKWWISWWDPDCDNAIFGRFRFQFDNANPSVWSDWRTTTSATKNPYNQVIDSSANHAAEVDGYGYRIHVPKDIMEPPVTKWEQPPNLTHLGMDVLSTAPMVLADDFRCTSTGPITEIHLFASWFQDVFPGLDPGMVSFTLSLHADIPQGPDGWSIPGPPLWFREYIPGQFLYHPYAIDLIEGWYNPVQSEYNPMGDTQCWEYIFYLDEGEFIQHGTPDIPVVYWLDVQAMPLVNGPLFGWKTTPLPFNWNDDAVWGQGPEPYPGPWIEMIYPPGHPWAGESINLAFTILGRVPQVTGACCRGHVCSTETATGCGVGGGYYVRDGWPCVPDPCCCRVMGNVDGSADNLVTMGDLTILIDHLFITLTPLTCWVEGNVDLSTDYLVTMSDLTVLIDHLFITLTPLPGCPW